MADGAAAAAFVSAIAACVSASAALLAMRIQRRNLLESVRPELVLTGWSRKAVGDGAAAHEVISFKTIKNAGRGAALHLNINSSGMVTGSDGAAQFPTYTLPTAMIPIIAPNELVELDAEIIVWWNNVPPHKTGGKYLPIRIKIFCWDSAAVRHETTYDLLAVDRLPGVIMPEIVRGVALGTRRTTATPAWRLKAVRTADRTSRRLRSFAQATAEHAAQRIRSLRSP